MPVPLLGLNATFARRINGNNMAMVMRFFGMASKRTRLTGYGTFCRRKILDIYFMRVR